MAAKVLTAPDSIDPTVHDAFAGDTTIDKLREITVHAETHSVIVSVVDAAGAGMAFKVTHTGTDATAIGANYTPIAAGGTYAQDFPAGGGTIYVSGDAATPTIAVASSIGLI